MTEKIKLLSNNKFIYSKSEEFYNFTVNGNFNIYNDTLTLDSYPQKDKIIVLESFEGNKKKSVFKVQNKRNESIVFHLTIFFQNDSSAIFHSEFDKTIVSSRKIKSFFIETTMGIKSPCYLIKGKNVNYFEIMIETSRVFENEKWLIKDKKIQPLGINGKIQNYYLEKND